MTKTTPSGMVRLPNALIPPFRELNRLYRGGYSEAVVQGLGLLIQAVERGESFGDAAIAARLDRLERLAGVKAPAKFQNLEFAPAVPRALRESELLAKFGIDVKRLENAIARGFSKERWISLRTGWRPVEFGRWLPGEIAPTHASIPTASGLDKQ